MKTIYLCESAQTVYRVYQVEDTVYTKADVLQNPAAFAETETIFSTWGMPTFTEGEIQTCFPNLKSLFYAAGSVQDFARPFLHCGVRIFSAWTANAVPVAEYTAAQIVLANKGFFATMRYTDRDRAEALHANYCGNYGATVGIIGAGMIGNS